MSQPRTTRCWKTCRQPRHKGSEWAVGYVRLAEEQAQAQGVNEVRLYTKEAMTEDLTSTPATATGRRTAPLRTGTNGSSPPKLSGSESKVDEIADRRSVKKDWPRAGQGSRHRVAPAASW